MSHPINGAHRPVTTSLALSEFARSQATIDRALRLPLRDRMESFRKITAPAAVPRGTRLIDVIARGGFTRTAGSAPLASTQRTPLASFAKQQVHRPTLAVRGAASNHAPYALPRRPLMELFVERAKIASEITALTKVQTGGLAAQLAGAKAVAGLEALTKPLAASMAVPKLTAGKAAVPKVQIGARAAGRARRHAVLPAIEGMRQATKRYAATTRALESPRRPGQALRDSLKMLDAGSIAAQVYDGEVKPFPAVRNYAADLVCLQHEAAERRERERREAVDHRRQSLALQIAMRDALIASEEARATDAEASAKRELAAVDREIAAEERAKASDEREAKMLKLTMISVTVGGGSLLVTIMSTIGAG